MLPKTDVTALSFLIILHPIFATAQLMSQGSVQVGRLHLHKQTREHLYKFANWDNLFFLSHDEVGAAMLNIVSCRANHDDGLPGPSKLFARASLRKL